MAPRGSPVEGLLLFQRLDVSPGPVPRHGVSSAFGPCALQVSKSACVLTTQAIMRLLKSKDAAAAVDVRTWPTILDTGACPQLCKLVCTQVPPTSPLSSRWRDCTGHPISVGDSRWSRWQRGFQAAGVYPLQRLTAQGSRPRSGSLHWWERRSNLRPRCP